MRKNDLYGSADYAEICRLVSKRAKKFIGYFEETGDPALSALYAGYTEDKAKAEDIGVRLLRNPKIAAYRRLRTLDLYERRGLTPEAVILRIDDFYLRSLKDAPHMSRNKETREMEPDGTWTYDSKDAFNALKLLGNVFGIFARKTDAADGAGETIEEFLGRMGGTEQDE